MKKLVNVRVEESLVESFDAWADEQGWSRTRAIERYMEAMVDPTPLNLRRAGLLANG